MTVLNVKDIYQDLHQIPEVGFQEFKTSAYLADALEKIGYKVTRNVGGTGVIGEIKGSERPRADAARRYGRIAFRH